MQFDDIGVYVIIRHDKMHVFTFYYTTIVVLLSLSVAFTTRVHSADRVAQSLHNGHFCAISLPQVSVRLWDSGHFLSRK